jgi:ABC-type branched-subunit amino acid transport system ATPase component
MISTVSNNSNNSIYQKISAIQHNIEDLKKDGVNKFQNYKYFTKEQVLRTLKPLLEEQKVNLIISDSETPAEYLKNEKEYTVKHLKLIKLIDLENTESQLNLKF